jgi:spermidine/putrescine transport system substrate-binding protein
MRNNNFLQNQFVQFILKMQVRLLFILFWVMILLGFILLSHVSQHVSQTRSLSVYMWADKIDESILQKFEQETGIKVYVNYYESNEELVTKFEIAKDLNCDVILPSEYIIETLAKAGFLKKLDKSRCDFIDRISLEFMGKYFDVNNDYSLPIYWDMLGFGYTKSYFPDGLPSNSWNLIFDANLVPCKQISMVDDSREAIFLANKYFDFDCKALDASKLEQIKKLFIEQKAWVGAYTDFQQGYFLTSKTYPLAVCQREIVVRQMLLHNDLAFTVPDEGSLLILSNVVICASSEKDDMIYQFLNYIYKHEVLMYNCKQFCILPVVKDVLELLPPEYIGVENLLPGEQYFDRLEIFPNILTQKQINDIWIAFKSF